METNKILGAIILALLLAAVFSKVADMAIHPEFPDELAYKIEIPEGGVTTSVSEDVDIFAVLPEITPMLASASMENGEKILKNVLLAILMLKVVRIKLVLRCGV